MYAEECTWYFKYNDTLSTLGFCEYDCTITSKGDPLNSNENRGSALLMLGVISLWAVGFYFLLSPKFKMHPYPLLGTVCLFDSASLQATFGFTVRCGE